MPNLGQMLANNILEAQQAEESARATKLREEQEEAARQADIAKRFFDGAQRYFTEAITQKMPANTLYRQVGGSRFNHLGPCHSEFDAILDRYSRNTSRTEPASLSDPKKFKSVWDDFKAWASDNGLVAFWEEGWDGGGTESWWVLRVRPA